MSLQGRKILLGVTGGIAAYKSADLVRRLTERGAVVRVAMTSSATALEFAPGVFMTSMPFLRAWAMSIVL